MQVDLNWHMGESLGRRALDATLSEIGNDVLGQIGALSALWVLLVSGAPMPNPTVSYVVLLQWN